MSVVSTLRRDTFFSPVRPFCVAIKRRRFVVVVAMYKYANCNDLGFEFCDPYFLLCGVKCWTHPKGTTLEPLSTGSVSLLCAVKSPSFVSQTSCHCHRMWLLASLGLRFHPVNLLGLSAIESPTQQYSSTLVVVEADTNTKRGAITIPA